MDKLGWKFSGLGLVFALSFMFWWTLFIHPDSVKIKFGPSFRERLQVVDMIRKGLLKPEPNGVVELPGSYQKLSVTGAVDVENRGADLMVVFRVADSRDGVENLIYYSGNEDLAFKSEKSTTTYGSGTETPVEKKEPVVTLPCRKLQDHWFYVNTMEKHAEAH